MAPPARLAAASHVSPSVSFTRRPRVAYVLGRAPQVSSTFTHDELAALEEHTQVVRCGLVADSPDDGWHVAPGVGSSALWAAAVAWLGRRPLAFASAMATLVFSSLTARRDLAAALRAALAGAYLARNLDVDVVHAQFAGPAAAGAYVWHRLTGVPYTIRAHAYDIYRPYRWAGPVMRSSAVVLAISQQGAREIRRRWNVEAPVVRVGVSAGSVPQRDDRSCSQPLRVLSVGALEPKKGHETLIQAVREANLHQRTVTLDIYGQGSLRDRLQQLAEPGVVELKGHLEPNILRSRYAEYDAFALAATRAADGDTDGIPVVLMEASLAGLPVVTTNVGGIPELIEHAVTGWATEPSTQQIAGALRAVADDYPAARRSALLARERVLEQHDLRAAAAQLTSIWASLASRQASDPR